MKISNRLAGMLHNNSLQIAEDLIAFYNIVEDQLDDNDLKLLANLYNSGRFESWECPTCEKRVYQATPENWDNFQGCYNPDYLSYREGHKRQCDSCRMHNPLTEYEAGRLGLVLSEMLAPISKEESMRLLMSAFGL